MKPNGQYKDENGKEFVMYPLGVLNITQDSGDPYSHGTVDGKKSWAIDHNKTSGVKEPVYAPFTGTLRVTDPVNGQGYFQSAQEVHHASGVVDFCTFLFAHSEDLPPDGTMFQQGQLMFHTGAMGLGSGVHIHIEVAPNLWNTMEYLGVSQSGYDVWIMNGQQDPALSFFIDDTILFNVGTHNWVETGTDPVILISNDIDEYLILKFL